MLAAWVILSGCDSASFIPPPPESKTPADSGFAAARDGAGKAATSAVPAAGKRAGGTVRIVELILDGPANSDRMYFEQVLRGDLAKSRIPLRRPQTDPPESSSGGDLAGAIRAAVGRGAAGLIVEPRDEPAVIRALLEAVDRGVAVLLLDRPVPARSGKTTIPHVEFVGFSDVGRQIVAAVLEADRSLNPAKPGRLVLLHRRSDDPYRDRCFESLLGPCKAAGKPMQTLEFEGDAETAVAALRKSLTADPTMDVLIADDAIGLAAGFKVHVEATESGRRGFLLAGYTSYDYRMITFVERIQAFGDRSVDSYAAKTSRAIRTLLEGKPVGDTVEVPVAFQRNPKPAARETVNPEGKR
jgi:ABC-type sugar transport system substrate-binding protein